jgi:hypothetical protein
MNCRTVRMMAIAIGLCVITATASNAFAKEKPKHGSVSAITQPVATAGTTSAVAGSIEITETDKATKAETKTTYPLSDSVSVTVKGDPGKLSDIAVGDKISFTITDGKVSTIKKGRAPKKPA